MTMSRSSLLFILLLLVGKCCAQSRPSELDTTAHLAQYIEVQPRVKLEVLDYGGSGRPMVFLAALGQTGHDWDKFAPKFVPKYHVYTITRRGFGKTQTNPRRRMKHMSRTG